ncbi:hypothetical protein DFH06DRAFT_979159 [Mycena polygramma]|nr:hypothetical protein DFH06DRAFT_979159 [Mycena polygramma]
MRKREPNKDKAAGSINGGARPQCSEARASSPHRPKSSCHLLHLRQSHGSRSEDCGADVGQTDAENEMDARKAAGAKKSTPQMSRAVAEILTAPCKPEEQDRQFCNPPHDPPCLCATCKSSPPPSHPVQCLCSGCTPETPSQKELYQPPPKVKKPASDIPQHRRLTKVMKAVAQPVGASRLEEFRFSVWSDAFDETIGLTPLADFLPDITIKQMLDRVAKIECFADLVVHVQDLRGMAGYHSRLFEVIMELRETFREMRKTGNK